MGPKPDLFDEINIIQVIRMMYITEQIYRMEITEICAN